ncbi:hypothetical protein EST38_g9254 [Candolleomyces aberdarensis]|uniref:Uncharacterized protein n=1 Tax=Candolleomyces aberdarensis TaxID=2316362 RepID=A0A4Q2DDB7_9AGAR|nr:hypothetical protein EST38_g9254 [Candolleomyces aberdarensis]
MLFPRLELWHGVLITGFDVILVLAMGDPLRGRPVRLFEFLIAGMVLAVLVCMCIIISKVDVNWGDAFQGYIPSKYIFQSGGLYTSVGILGATVMPHSLFIGSALATQDRIEFREPINDEYDDSDSPDSSLYEVQRQPSRWQRIWNSSKKNFMRAFQRPSASYYTRATRHCERENNPFEFVSAHLYHGIVDVVVSLLGFAVLINSLILILASAVFFYGTTWDGNGDPASLFDAYDLIRDLVGKPAATLFAIALLASGQSSSLIATVAGQAVCEGFLQWRVSVCQPLTPFRMCIHKMLSSANVKPFIRRLITRLLAIIPSTIVAVAIGRPGVDALLVASQVVLSIVLPFITFPLLWCTSSKAIMSVRKKKTKTPDSEVSTMQSQSSDRDVKNGKGDAGRIEDGPTKASGSSAALSPSPSPSISSAGHKKALDSIASSVDSDSSLNLENGEDGDEIVDYSNNKLTIAIGAVIWLIVVAANVYALVDLGLEAAKS